MSITTERAVMALLSGTPLATTSYVPEGELIVANYGGGRKVFGNVLTVFSLTHNAHYPFESFFSRGRIELERDRRRRGKTHQS